jgi:hypothetical protein
MSRNRALQDVEVNAVIDLHRARELRHVQLQHDRLERAARKQQARIRRIQRHSQRQNQNPETRQDFAALKKQWQQGLQQAREALKQAERANEEIEKELEVDLAEEEPPFTAEEFSKLLGAAGVSLSTEELARHLGTVPTRATTASASSKTSKRTKPRNPYQLYGEDAEDTGPFVL